MLERFSLDTRTRTGKLFGCFKNRSSGDPFQCRVKLLGDGQVIQTGQPQLLLVDLK